MIAVIDNYDSFTFNLVQYIGEIYGDIKVFRNDAITVDALGELCPAGIVISPGPCTPLEAGISVETIQKLGPTIPLLGVCLGHQSIGQAFGGKVIRAPYLMHGKVSQIHHNGTGLFKNIPSPSTSTRYHSLIIEKASCPKSLIVNAETEDGIIMAVSHETYPIHGLQFHPESILTQHGKIYIKNFIEICTNHARHS